MESDSVNRVMKCNPFCQVNFDGNPDELKRKLFRCLANLYIFKLKCGM